MSHELRTPLNAIIGYESLLADGVTGPVSDAQRRQLDRIGASAHHLLMLIDDADALALEAGRVDPHETVDVARRLDEAARSSSRSRSKNRRRSGAPRADRPSGRQREVRQAIVTFC